MSCRCSTHTHAHMPTPQHTNPAHTQHSAHNTPKYAIICFLLSLLCFIAALTPLPAFIQTIFFTSCILLAGYRLLWDGLKSIVRLRCEEEVLMSIACVAACLLGEHMESCMIVLLFRIGEFLEEAAIRRSQKNFKTLHEILPETANLLQIDGSIQKIPTRTIPKYSRILLRPGDRAPLDCIVEKGTSSIDRSAITGESAPYYVETGSPILSGSVNGEGSLTCITTKRFEDSAASQIIQLVYDSLQKKGKTEKFITKFSRIYTPIVLIIGCMLAVLPFLFGILPWQTSILRSLIFLVAACPCALILSTPLAFFSAIGVISKHGVLLKGTEYVESLAQLDCIALDKTGTITTGTLEVEKFELAGKFKKELVLSYAHTLEQYSTHPIAEAVCQYANDYPTQQIDQIKEYPGLGITAQIDGHEVLFGNNRLLQRFAVSPPHSASVYLVINQTFAASFTFAEVVSSNQKRVFQELKDTGIQKIIMLTGDHPEAARKVAQVTAIDHWYASLLPSDKVAHLEEYKKKYKTVGFVGDGINDAPVLAAAKLGISMGLGSESANNTSDVILTNNQLYALPKAIQLAKRSMHVVYFNIIFILIVKFLIMTLCVGGIAPMWLGILADTGITLITILNAIRIFSFKTVK